MKIAKITIWASLVLILTIIYLNQSQKDHSSVSLETTPITEAEMQMIMEATIQIYLFPSESLEALGVDQHQNSLSGALTDADVEYRYEIGLGTLVSHSGEIILITHDHWGALDNLRAVQFRNASGDPLLELDGVTFKDMIRYQDGGTMILGRSTDGDQSDFLSAMGWTSQTKHNQRMNPVELDPGKSAGMGDRLIVVRQGRNGTAAVELISSSVESIEERWGQLVYKLQNGNDENIMPGDSGGGLWLGCRFVGNMWKSMSTFSWNWDTLALEKKWTETSYAAGLPDFVDEVPLSLDAVKSVDDVEPIATGEEF